jgi:hypothetical protein
MPSYIRKAWLADERLRSQDARRRPDSAARSENVTMLAGVFFIGVGEMLERGR